VAAALADGAIVGVMQGRAEWGPRALGHRSILADPRQADIQAVLNAKVKFREGFRPFAPAILHEHGPDWFENYQFSPYMERALRWRPEVRDRVPGVVHANGTGRLQSVTAEHNPFFHAVLRAFFAQTGVPVLLNTSFNVMGKPIVHGVEDAIAVYCTTGLDALLVEDFWVSREGR
jgi:carbamoyltransferase